MGFKLYLQDANLQWFRGTAFPPPPGTIFLSIHSAAEPSLANEVSYLAGGRIQVLSSWFSAPRWLNDVVDGTREIVNNRAFIFDLATGTADVRSFALSEAEVGGTMFVTGDVIPDVTVTEGDPVVFLTGALSIRVN